MASVTATSALARALLYEHEDQERAAGFKAYIKTPFPTMGATKPAINTIARQLKRELKGEPRSTLDRVITDLWTSAVHEEMSLAVTLSAVCVKRFAPSEIDPYFGTMLDQCQTWDHVDELCSKVTGVLALQEPREWQTIATWADSDHMWTRRSALVSHLPAIRAAALEEDLLLTTIRKLAHEKEFFIRKAIGWVLRDLSTRDLPALERIFQEVGPVLSGLSRREATRKLGAADRERMLVGG